MSVGELKTDPEYQVIMHNLLSDFYCAALESLEQQIKRGKEVPQDPEGRPALSWRSSLSKVILCYRKSDKACQHRHFRNCNHLHKFCPSLI